MQPHDEEEEDMEEEEGEETGKSTADDSDDDGDDTETQHLMVRENYILNVYTVSCGAFKHFISHVNISTLDYRGYWGNVVQRFMGFCLGSERVTDRVLAGALVEI